MATKRLTVRVKEATYVPWYAYHESTNRRRASGEKIGEVEIHFEPYDHTSPTGYRIVFDQEAMDLCKTIGVKSPASLEGWTVTIETDNYKDVLLPVRLIDIH